MRPASTPLAQQPHRRQPAQVRLSAEKPGPVHLVAVPGVGLEEPRAEKHLTFAADGRGCRRRTPGLRMAAARAAASGKRSAGAVDAGDAGVLELAENLNLASDAAVGSGCGGTKHQGVRISDGRGPTEALWPGNGPAWDDRGRDRHAPPAIAGLRPPPRRVRCPT